MYQLLYILTDTVNIVLEAMALLILARVVLTILMFDEDSKIVGFIYMLTEPILIPFRILCDKIELFNNIPVDMSLIMASLAILIIQLLLPTV